MGGIRSRQGLHSDVLNRRFILGGQTSIFTGLAMGLGGTQDICFFLLFLREHSMCVCNKNACITGK